MYGSPLRFELDGTPFALSSDLDKQIPELFRVGFALP